MNSVYNGPKYKTYKLSNIYSMMLHEEREISNDLDTLSMFFNILLVNYNKNIISKTVDLIMVIVYNYKCFR